MAETNEKFMSGLFTLKSVLEIFIFFGAISTRCTHQSSPQMTAGVHYTFFWTSLSDKVIHYLCTREFILIWLMGWDVHVVRVALKKCILGQ